MITTYILLSIIILSIIILSITILSITILLLTILLLTWLPDQVSWVSGSGTWSTPCLITVLPRKK